MAKKFGYDLPYLTHKNPNTSTTHLDKATIEFDNESLPPFTDREISQAFAVWLRNCKAHELDWKWRTYKVNRGCDWLRQARKGLKLSAQTVADTLNITRQAVHALELSEETGALTLKTFEKAAAALNCEMRYSLRPVNDKQISAVIWNQVLPHALKQERLLRIHPCDRVYQLALTVDLLCQNQEFRSSLGWSRYS